MTIRVSLTMLVAAAALHWGAMPAMAQTASVQTAAPQPKAVVELFTSQGCSSCPAADALFVELAKNPGLIALTLPVTYWDYLGWKDTLGQDAFTKRQKQYSKVRGDGQVYTPQAVINGTGHAIGSNRGDIEKAMAPTAFIARIAVKTEGSVLAITVTPLPDAAGREAAIWVLPTTGQVTVPIARGENGGRTVTYANVVRGLVRVGDWKGGEASVSVPLETIRVAGADGYVVLLQAEQPGRYGMMPGAILAAAQTR